MAIRELQQGRSCVPVSLQLPKSKVISPFAWGPLQNRGISMPPTNSWYSSKSKSIRNEPSDHQRIDKWDLILLWHLTIISHL
ncbi:hypothetical protein OIU84_013222 [Salix udensis]|uniref:Uncharacterized protein n=1 Tax=Salix udensis TaxID=889485 RepID=A0AAD6NU64_9ROSI|nr:hypothetical protein OIU84_013222 [Salix udensis]